MNERKLERARAEVQVLRKLVDQPRNATLQVSNGDRKLHILVAEDNDLIALLTGKLLQRDGHVVHRVINGREAVEAMRRTKFDLVLMDIQMPEMDGIEATVRIRQDERERGEGPSVIWAMTATVDEELARCMSAGANGAFTKPLGFEQLRARMKKLNAQPVQELQRTTG